MRRNAIRVGWGLIVLGLITLAVVVPTGAHWAKGDKAFTNWVDWATIWAVVIGAIGVLPLAWGKVFPTNKPDGSSVTADRLASAVFREATDLRRRLIGLGDVSDKPANVRFAKLHGRFREVDGPRSGDLQGILRYYRSLSPARLVILGEPGAGKTVLAIELQIGLLEERKQDTARPVPVLISAASYDVRQEWPQWLTSYLATRFAFSTLTARQLVEDDRILPVIDGLDEMDAARAADAGSGEAHRSADREGRADSSTAGKSNAAKLVAALNRSFHGRQPVPVVITCRPGEYRQLDRGIDGAARVEMIPLDGSESSEYLEGQFSSDDEASRWAPVTSTLRTEPNGPLAARLGTPWRLTLALGAFRYDGEPGALLLAAPDSTESSDGAVTAMDRQLLGQYFDNAVRRAGTAPYRAANVQRWLTALASGLAWQGSHAKSATDIDLVTWWEPSGRRTARLLHSVLLLVPGTALAGLVNILYTGGLFNYYFSIWNFRGLLFWSAEIAGTWAVVLVPGTLAARPPSARRLSLQQMFTRRGALRFTRGFAGGFALGLAIVFVLTTISENRTSFSVELIIRQIGAVGLILASALGLMAGLASGLVDPTPKPVGPREVITADGRYMLSAVAGLTLLVALGFGLIAGIETYLGNKSGASGTNPWTAAFEALAAGAVIGLVVGYWIAIMGAGVRGSSAWTRYRITVVVNWLRKRAPLRFGAFLDWCRDAGLLRVSGITYQFRHRQIQEWLTPSVDNQHRDLDDSSRRRGHSHKSPAVSTIIGIVTITIIVIVWALLVLHRLDTLSTVRGTP